MGEFKANFMKWLPAGIILFCAVSLPLGAGLFCLKDMQNNQLQQVTALEQPVIDLGKPVQQILTQIAQANQAKPKQSEPRPLPEAVTMALYKRDQELEQMRKLVSGLTHQIQTMQYRTTGKPPAVDRSGNTEQALNDIYADVFPPVLPDPMVKALARNPGSRIVADPDTGEYIPEDTAWRETTWGGGKQLHLMRHRGKLYGQSVLYRSRIKQQEQAEQQPAKEEKSGFNLNLGNN